MSLSKTALAKKLGVSRRQIDNAISELSLQVFALPGKTATLNDEIERLITNHLRIKPLSKHSNLTEQIKCIYQVFEDFTSADNVTLEDIQKRQNFLERLPDLIELHQALLEQQKIRLQLLGE